MTTNGDAMYASGDAVRDTSTLTDVVHVINRAHQCILAHGDSRLFDVIDKICDGPYAAECACALADGKTAGVWFAHACAHKWWSLIHWLLFMYGELDARHAKSAFAMACAHGHGSVARWLIDKFWPGTEEIDYLVYIASNGRVFRLTKQLFTRYTPYFRAQATLVNHVRDAFANACRHRRIWFIRWLDQTYGLTVDDVCHRQMEAFTAACAGGHWPLARWMVIRFELTREHICDADCDPLAAACLCGQLHVAQWLVARFRLAAQDVRGQYNSTFIGACSNGHLEVARWLADRFCLTARDAHSGHNAALITASYNGHMAMARWLVERFGLGREGMRVGPTYISVRGTEITCVTVKWLLMLFRVNRRKKANIYHVLIESTAEEDRIWFAHWMAKRFGIMPCDVESTLDAYTRYANTTKHQAERAQRWFNAFAAEW